MGTGVRDVDVGSEVQDLAAYGYFDEEVAFYGCAYVQKGRIYYRVNEQEAMLWRFLQNAAQHGIYPTLMEQFYQRVKIPAGGQEKIKEAIRLSFVQQLKQAYPREYFELLGPLARSAATNAAADLFVKWRRDLAACFDEEAYQLLAGALRMAYEGKLLDAPSYHQMMAWCADRMAQIERQGGVSSTYNWLFSGFAYEEEGQWRYFYDANELVVSRKRYRWLQKGVVTTPIFQHKYCRDTLRTGDILQLEQDFAQMLRRWLDAEYLERIIQIKAMPSAIEWTVYADQDRKVQQLKNERAQTAFDFWCWQWNCKKP